MKLYKHQEEALELISDYNRCAIYYDMGLGKTYIGSEKMHKLNGKVNLIVCQKSKINDWYEHMFLNYPEYLVSDLSRKSEYEDFIGTWSIEEGYIVGVINYDLIWRRPELLHIKYDTIMLDESSLIKDEDAKRTRAILRMRSKNVILLSGSICGGKYEQLYSQMKLLGWKISKTEWWNRYILYHMQDFGFGIPFKQVDGYKNTNEMLREMHEHGCIFKKTDEVIDLPAQNDIPVTIPTSKYYKKFAKSGVVNIDGEDLVADTSLTELLHLRQLAGAYSEEKLKAFEDILESTDDRVVVFYNFNEEWHRLGAITDKLKRPSGVVNGQFKHQDVLDKYDNAVLFVQYQAGAMGLNLQKANKIIYFSPTLSSDLYEQSRKRIHRIGQERTCFYYQLTCGIEKNIYETLAERRDFTDALFRRLKK